MSKFRRHNRHNANVVKKQHLVVLQERLTYRHVYMFCTLQGHSTTIVIYQLDQHTNTFPAQHNNLLCQ